jgi:tellurite resistance protein
MTEPKRVKRTAQCAMTIVLIAVCVAIITGYIFQVVAGLEYGRGLTSEMRGLSNAARAAFASELGCSEANPKVELFGRELVVSGCKTSRRYACSPADSSLPSGEHSKWVCFRR